MNALLQNGLGSSPRTWACFSSVKVLLGYIPSSKVGSEPDPKAVLLFGLPPQPASGSSGTAMSNLIICQVSSQYPQSTFKLQKTCGSRGTQSHDCTHLNSFYLKHTEKKYMIKRQEVCKPIYTHWHCGTHILLTHPYFPVPLNKSSSKSFANLFHLLFSGNI